MRLRAFLPASLVVMAVFGTGAGSASAVTLFTTTAHTTRVTLGATSVATGTNLVLTSGTAVVFSCGDATLNMLLTQNNDTAVKFSITGSTFNSCSPFAWTGTHTTPWTLTVSGTSFVSGTSTAWNASIDSLHFDVANGSYTGDLTTGVTVSQPTAAGGPITLKLASAGTFTGPLTGGGRLDGSFVWTGAASAYSFTN